MYTKKYCDSNTISQSLYSVRAKRMYRFCEWRNDITATAITVHTRGVVVGNADSGFTKHPYPICLFNGSALKLTFKYAIWNRDYTAFSAL